MAYFSIRYTHSILLIAFRKQHFFTNITAQVHWNRKTVAYNVKQNTSNFHQHCETN